MIKSWDACEDNLGPDQDEQGGAEDPAKELLLNIVIIVDIINIVDINIVDINIVHINIVDIVNIIDSTVHLPNISGVLDISRDQEFFATINTIRWIFR